MAIKPERPNSIESEFTAVRTEDPVLTAPPPANTRAQQGLDDLLQLESDALRARSRRVQQHRRNLAATVSNTETGRMSADATPVLKGHEFKQQSGKALIDYLNFHADLLNQYGRFGIYTRADIENLRAQAQEAKTQGSTAFGALLRMTAGSLFVDQDPVAIRNASTRLSDAVNAFERRGPKYREESDLPGPGNV